MKRRAKLAGFIVAASVLLGGCAGAPKTVVTPSRLGSVIVYKNGVAYFERYAAPGEETISLRVPTERVDDFLKSLSIVDQQSGEALPVSYPTMETYDGYVEMTITLPPKHGRLEITYVTESPAWKPSYRVVLKDDGKARLQGWAVVDNVSGEDWKDVHVGVGSTSALSFRYDLHSIRLVERETLASGSQLAHAPPSGGSPYAVAKKKVRVLDNIAPEELAVLDGKVDAHQISGVALAAESSGGSGGRDEAPPPTAQERQREQRARRFSNDKYLDKLREEATNNRIRVEGFAQSGDGDALQASQARAEQVKQRLVHLGVPAGNIEAVGTGAFDDRQAVRILADEERQGKRGEETPTRAPRDTLPVGQAHFVSDEAMTIRRAHSAMVSTLNELTQAERIYFYDPLSDRGSQKFAFNAVRIDNPSGYTLDAGPFTVYADGQFLGEGLSEAILPHATAFIPYALDRSIVADPQTETREEIESLRTIERGVVSTETRQIRRTRLTLSNRGKRQADVFVRHQVAKGYTLTPESLERRDEKLHKLDGAHLFRVSVPPGEAVELEIEEWSPLLKTVDLRTDEGVRAIGLFLRKRDMSPELQDKLRVIIERHEKTTNLEEKIGVISEQLDVYRTRIDELNFQLATLRKVRGSEKLRRHLQNKMREISDTLQASTLEISELKGELMTERIALQDCLAELTLERPEADEAPEEVAAR